MRCQTTAPKPVRRAATALVSVLLSACVLAALPASLLAQGHEIATTAVVTFQDQSGRRSRLLETKATDAVALALAESKEYLVTPAADVERELKSLGLTPPLNTTEAVRLGRRLDVSSVTEGQILQASADPSSGRATVRLQILMVDVAAEEPLDGAVTAVETKGVPGYQGSEADLLNEALRQAAERSVDQMMATHVRRGTIEAVVSSGNCEINLGAQDGVQPGMDMVVMRPVYLRDLEKVVLRQIGQVKVAQVQADICYATPHANVAPRTGDYVLRIYEPATQTERAVAKKRTKSFAFGAMALGVLFGIVAVATGGNVSSSPGSTVISYLHQNGPGDGSPTIRVQYLAANVANGHLLFRGESAGFPPEAPYLVEVSGQQGEERLSFIDDVPASGGPFTRTITVEYVDESGAPATATVDCGWTHPALSPGQFYYHRIRRVDKPQLPPGSNPPIGKTGAIIASVTSGAGSPVSAGLRRASGTRAYRPFQDPTNTITQSADFPMISEPSNVAGPVTYIQPSNLTAVEGVPQNPNGPIDFTWSQTTGADEYMIQIFPAADPNGLGQPAFQMTGIRATGPGNVTKTLTFSPPLAANSAFGWRVGSRNSLEATDNPRGQGITQVTAGTTVLRGWVLTFMSPFTTNSAPPPPPSVAKRGRHLQPLPGSSTPPGAGAPGPVPAPPSRGRGGSGNTQPAPPTLGR